MESQTEAAQAPAGGGLRRPNVSVRMRIVTVITLVAALGLLSVGMSVYAVERHRILEQIDSRLAANLESGRFIVSEGDPVTGVWSSSSDALRTVVQRMSPDDNTGAMGLVDGEVAYVPGVPLDVDLMAQPEFASHVVAQTAAGEPVIGTYAERGVAWRYLAAPVSVEGSADPAVALFAMVYDIDAELAEFNVAARVFLIASALAVAVIALVGTVVAGRLLRPLRRMRETAERVSAQSLSERLPVGGRDDVSELAQTMNEMFDRLDRALESQRRLLSDVGHELKTPITIVRGHIEVMDPDDPDDVRETQQLTVDELDRMGRLVQDLAGAAALHGPAPVQLLPVDSADLLRQIVRKAQGIEGAEVTQGDVAEVVAVLDPARITQAMLQLAQNAVTHGGGRMVIGSRPAGDDIEFWVRDYGPGVPDAAKAQVFERFHRGDDALSRSGSGSGLGLTIVQMIARAHGGTARVVDAAGGGAMFLVTVPRGTPAASPAPEGVPGDDDPVIPPRSPLPARAAPADREPQGD